MYKLVACLFTALWNINSIAIHIIIIFVVPLLIFSFQRWVSSSSSGGNSVDGTHVRAYVFAYELFYHHDSWITCVCLLFARASEPVFAYCFHHNFMCVLLALLQSHCDYIRSLVVVSHNLIVHSHTYGYSLSLENTANIKITKAKPQFVAVRV